MFSGAKISDFKAFDSHIALVVYRENAGSASGCETPCVQYCDLSWITPKGDVAITRVAGRMDAYQLFVNSSSHVDGAARPHVVCGMLH